MQIGLKKKIKVYFPVKNSVGWLGGVNYYKNLLHALSLTENNPFIPILPSENPDELFAYAHKNFPEKNVLEKLLVKIFPLRKRNFYFRNKIDILSHCYKPVDFKPALYWIPDFQHLYLPEMFTKEELNQRNEDFKNMALNATAVILSSNTALQDFKKFVPEFSYKGRVLNFVAYINPEIYELTEFQNQKIHQKLNLFDKFFYIPNQFWKHKNHITVFKALGYLKAQGITINAVFSGRVDDYRDNSFKDLIYRTIEENKIADNIKILGVIEQSEVYYLMRHCVSIINPSLFEGWSTTVEEAKSLGKNIILSDIPVHREQAPSCAVYFDPLDYKQLAETLKTRWESSCGGPDFDLECLARESMNLRMKNFGEKYKEILLEAYFGIKNKEF